MSYVPGRSSHLQATHPGASTLRLPVSASRERGSELLAVDETGAGDPLVLIHGLATTRDIWSLVVPALARRRRVITLDVPGFGESPPAGEGFELDQVAARIVDGLRSRGIDGPFDLAGHSLGAGIAVTLASARRDLVRCLILVAPAGLHPRRRLPASVIAPAITPMFAVRRRLVPLTDFALGRQVLLRHRGRRRVIGVTDSGADDGRGLEPGHPDCRRVRDRRRPTCDPGSTRSRLRWDSSGESAT